MNLNEVREKYPQYKDVDDQRLADAIYKKYYSHAPREEFNKRIGYTPETKGWGGIGSDILGAVGKMPGQFIDRAFEMPGEVMGMQNQILNDPIRTMQNVGGGLIQGGQDILNAPSSLADYLKRKEVIPQGVNLPSIQGSDKPYAEVFGRQGERSGDKVLNEIGENIPFIGGEGFLKGPIEAVGRTAIKPIEAPIRGAKNLWNSSPAKIANKTVNERNRLIKESKEVYSNLDKSATEAGVSHIFERSPNSHLIERKGSGNPVSSDLGKKLHFDFLKDHLNTNAMTTFKKFLKNDSFKNARELSTSLAKSIEKLEKSLISLPENNRAIRRATSAKQKVDKQIDKALKGSKNPELANQYGEVKNWYAKEVAPIRHNKAIKEYTKSQKSAHAQQRLSEKLKNHPEFQDKAGHKFPELHSRENAIKLLKAFGIGAGSLGGGYAGYNALFGGHE